ncbi:MAG TPA: WHG domain-containing protein [Solirubrobacteraceae bacterium]|nr:WHG domain-containing protein [Solirubrobacteraceae bacterium]
MPRAGLSELVVVEEAERLIDEVGLSRLTLAELAARLGVRQPSLYKHIQGTDGLVRSISIRAKNELAYVLARAAVGRERADALSSISGAYRAWALDHPGRYATVQNATTPGDTEDEAASLAVLQVVTDILTGYKLADDDAIDAARALRSALHGFITLESSGAFGLPADIDRSFRRLIHGLDTAFSSWTEAPAARPRRK